VVVDLVLRQATVADTDAIARLLRAAFEEYRGRLDPPSGSLDATPEKVLERMRTARTLLAFQDDTLIGCVFSEPEDDSLYFFSLAVHPDQRRRGVGRLLIAAMEERARAMRLTGVRLGVRLALPRLLAYYNQQGYHMLEYRAHEGYLEPTYAILEKELRNLVEIAET
jgi:N-acetylglutamate synthase-like GNAT family acetyltransferase